MILSRLNRRVLPRVRITVPSGNLPSLSQTAMVRASTRKASATSAGVISLLSLSVMGRAYHVAGSIIITYDKNMTENKLQARITAALADEDMTAEAEMIAAELAAENRAMPGTMPAGLVVGSREHRAMSGAL